MPLIKREVVPIFLSRQLNARGADFELECVTNKTLSNIVLQLSSLSKHAEDIFGELYNEANSICKRSCGLQERIDKLSSKVTKLDATKDDVSLQDIQLRKAFKSSLALDQEVVSSHTMPSAMRDTYMCIDKPPKLSILSQYRDDGKEALKFYTDPKYFFELWCKEMQKNIHDIKQKKKKRNKNRILSTKADPVRLPQSRKDQFAHLQSDKEFRADKVAVAKGIGNTPTQSRTPQTIPDANHERQIQNNARNSRYDRRPAVIPPAPPEEHVGYPNGDIIRPGRPAPQPPPPPTNVEYPEVPPPLNENQMPSGNFMTHEMYEQQLNAMTSVPDPLPPPAPSPPPLDPEDFIPPPPPPPPPPGPDVGIVPPPPPMPLQGTHIVPKPPPLTVQPLPPEGQNDLPIHSPPVSPIAKPPVSDPRSDLLMAIARGINLKKTETAKERAREHETPDNSVEAILSRRIAVELSDSEASDSDTDTDDWDE